MQYARASLAHGICDRCAIRWDLRDLKFQWINGIESSLKVCPDCLDIDHEQLRTDQVDAHDPLVLEDPRPETNIDDSRGFFGFNPVNMRALVASVGQVH